MHASGAAFLGSMGEASRAPLATEWSEAIRPWDDALTARTWSSGPRA